MKNALKWIAVFMTASALTMTQRQIFPFLLFLAALLVIAPPLRGLLEKKIPLFRLRGMTALAWLGLYIFGMVMRSPIDPHIKHLEAQRNVGELIQIVQKQGDEAGQAAQALGNIGDRQAVKPLIAAIDAASTNAELRASGVAALAKLPPDRQAVQPLLKVLTSTASGETKTQVKSALKAIAVADPKSAEPLIADLLSENKDRANLAQQALAAMGQPVTEQLLALLKSDTKLPLVIKTLGEGGDPKAIKPLSAYLTDVILQSEASQALQQLNWQPKDERDRVHYWIGLQQGTMLNQNWEMTKRVLLADVQSGEPKLMEYALYSLIKIGNKDAIPKLVETLHGQESTEMAVTFLNCGVPLLEDAAQTWANDRGYEVVRKKTTVGTGVKWGQMGS
jgi:HEAT repeat protein